MENNLIQPESLKTTENQPSLEKKVIKISLKKAIIFGVIAVIIIAIGVLAYVYKGLFIAASVDGKLISRLSIIKKLEKASGKSLLDSIITEKLVQNEAKAKGINISDEEINSEIKTIESDVSAQGGTLDEALSIQGMSRDDLRNQIILQKEMEKLLGDKINVTDQEIDQYIKDNSVTLTAGQETTTKEQIKSEITNQKINTEAQVLITELKSKASIKYFVSY